MSQILLHSRRYIIFPSILPHEQVIKVSWIGYVFYVPVHCSASPCRVTFERESKVT